MMFKKNKKSTNPMMRDSKGDKAFRFFNGLVLGLLALIVLYPVYFIIIASFSDPDAVLGGKVVLWPVGINLDGYFKIMERTDVWQGYLNTIIYTGLTVVLSLLVTIPAGWALSRKTLPGKKFWMMYFIVPMFFGGGLIPFYNVMSSLGLINTPWAVVLPSILSVWNLFMTKTFFESSIPNTLIEAAKIDGASHFSTFTTVVLPLAKAIMAVMALYYAVGQWNSYFAAMLYIKDTAKQPIQNILRSIVYTSVTATFSDASIAITNNAVNTLNVQYACLVATIAPLLLIYPFIQKYFEQGMQVGAVKG